MIGSYREGETMPHLKNGVATLAAASLALLAGACNKGPAEDSLRAAEEALAVATLEIQRYAPGELAPLQGTLESARADLGKGNYTAALKAAQDLPARIRAALFAAAAQKDRQAAAWDELSRGLPGEIQAITGRLSGIADSGALPRGMTREALAAAQAELASVARGWSEAAAAFQGGDVSKALETGRDVGPGSTPSRGGSASRPRPPAGRGSLNLLRGNRGELNEQGGEERGRGGARRPATAPR